MNTTQKKRNACWLVSAVLLCTSAEAQLSLTGSDFLMQGVAGVPGTPASNEYFGQEVAVGDFNGDGFFDLALAAPYEDIAPVTDTGNVTILYGSGVGLDLTDNQVWSMNDIPGQAALSGERFGWALAVGNFDGNAFDDLAIGIPRRRAVQPDASIVSQAGAVVVLYGSANGLSSVSADFFQQAFNGIQGASEAEDRFGQALASGDFDGDGYSDLAIGVPQEDVGMVDDAGAINVIYGSLTGLTASGDQIWTQEDLGTSTSEFGDRFGEVLEAGDFDDNGLDDLAIGAPWEDWSEENAGTVFLIRGALSGLTAAGNQLFHQNLPGLSELAEVDDRFGAALAPGDFNGDGVEDLAIGSPGETNSRGLVHIVPGAAGVGLSSQALALLGRSTFGEVAEIGDDFGSTLAAGNFDGSAADELVISVYADVAMNSSAGKVFVVGGDDLNTPEHEVYDQIIVGETLPESTDLFGSALGTGDFDGNGLADLVIGVGYKDISGFGLEDVGTAHVLYASSLFFSDGFESGSTNAWSLTVP